MDPVPDARQGLASDGLALLQGLLASLPAAVAYLAGPDLIIEFANDAYRKLVGGRELTGRPLREALPELAGQGRLELLERILRTGEPAYGSGTEVCVRRRGEPQQRFLDFVCQPVHDADGAVTGLLLYAADVTGHVRDRRRLAAAARELSAAQERYRTLFETMPQGVIHFGADGTVIDANPAAIRIAGLDRGDLARWPLAAGVPAAGGPAVREDGTPFPPADMPVPRALRTGAIVPDVMLGVSHSQTGELRWLHVTAVPDARDSSGRPQRAYCIFTDLTDQLRTEAALRESNILLGRLRDANVLGVVLNSQHGILEANDAFLDIVGYDRAEVEGGRMSHEMLTPPEWAGADRDAIAQLRRSGAFQPYDKEYLHRDGHRVPVLLGGAAVGRRPLRWATFAVDLSAQQRAEQERTELLVREQTAHAEAEQARERLTLLLHASALAAASGDREQLLERATQLVVPSLADYCVVYLPAGGETLRPAAFTHRDEPDCRFLRGLLGRPIPIAGPLAIQAAYASGTTRLVSDLPAELREWALAEPDIAAALTKVGPASAVCVPLTAGQQRLGVMGLGRGPGRPPFATTDLAVLEELARRLAAGLATATTFAVEHTIAETLQRSLLPTLPSVPGLDIAARYLPATTGADVGGDWYDVFEAGGGEVGLVIGDVTGHSIASASVMGQIRSMLRAYAAEEPHPLAVLRRTGRAVARLLPAALATVTCALLDVRTEELSYASAGHLPPLLAGGDGRTVFLDQASGIMLGAAPDLQLRPGRRQLQPGDSVLFYTDGLVECHGRDLSAGLATLASALTGPAGRSADQICTAAQSALLPDGSRTDDVCLLAVRCRDRQLAARPAG